MLSGLTLVKCGRHHPGECWLAQGLCLGCGQPGHFRRHCPTNPSSEPVLPRAPDQPAASHPARSQQSTAANNQQRARPQQSGRAPARTYAMHGRTDPSPDVILGTFILFDSVMHALIDPGSTLSYICVDMPANSAIVRSDLEIPTIVSNPLGHSMRLHHVYHRCPLSVQGKQFPADLIELPHKEFDIILGMDWLTEHRAVVDCSCRTVRLRAEDGSDVSLSGEVFPKAPEFISSLSTRRLIRKKCEMFLCHVQDMRKELPRQQDIRTVCDFPDVFPEDLPSLPPPRELQSPLEQEIRTAQRDDEFCQKTRELVPAGKRPEFAIRDDGVLYYRERLVVPRGEEGKDESRHRVLVLVVLDVHGIVVDCVLKVGLVGRGGRSVGVVVLILALKVFAEDGAVERWWDVVDAVEERRHVVGVGYGLQRGPGWSGGTGTTRSGVVPVSGLLPEGAILDDPNIRHLRIWSDDMDVRGNNEIHNKEGVWQAPLGGDGGTIHHVDHDEFLPIDGGAVDDGVDRLQILVEERGMVAVPGTKIPGNDVEEEALVRWSRWRMLLGSSDGIVFDGSQHPKWTLRPWKQQLLSKRQKQKQKNGRKGGTGERQEKDKRTRGGFGKEKRL
ncbi:unnamed protein product [Cuscuta campestris]|uniref:CCHC-type domain-containing protein n=1 Tax=Cuscuta campestris TaxID=132261 RepID=A0A484MAE6_9ASTE|nr:unnamed protein product [Cuscuta campestris]